MRIGIMLRHLHERGGPAVYTVGVLEQLLKLDADNEYVLLHRDPRMVGRFGRRENLREHVLRAPGKFAWDQLAVGQFAARAGLDLVYNPKLSVPLFAPCRTAFTMHGAEQFMLPHLWPRIDRLYFTLLMPLYCARADRIFTTSHRTSDDLVRLLHISPRKMRVAYNAPHPRFHPRPLLECLPVRTRYGLPDRFVLYVGGLAPHKNFGNLLRAFNSVARAFPDHHLVVVGFKRHGFHRDVAMIDELGLTARVLLAGFVDDDDLAAMYNLADLFVFPSLYEGFGIAQVEALASGCPVVASCEGGSPEAVGDAALIVDPRDAGAIAAAMTRLLDDPSLRAALRARGLERVKSLGWDRVASTILSTIHELADRPR
jgi:glycosyltransferase involved in cell wall biosynthesis